MRFQRTERLLGGFEMLLQDDQLRLLLKGRRVTKRLQGFVQLGATHGHGDFGFFDRRLSRRLIGIYWRYGNRCRALGPRQPLSKLVRFFALQARVAVLIASPCPVALDAALLAFVIVGSQVTHNRQDADRWAHLNAIHGAGRHTQVAPGALINDDGVHQLGGADNRVHRAGLDAFGAADALGLADIRDLRWGFASAGVQFQHRHPQ